MSFVYIGIYWNNHHHMFQSAKTVNGAVLWANLHLLFWLSLAPVVTRWLADTGICPFPVAAYGFIFFMAGLAYYILSLTLISANGKHSELAKALGKDFKGKISVAVYAVAIGLAWVVPTISVILYVAVAIMWLVPDQRFERVHREVNPSV